MRIVKIHNHKQLKVTRDSLGKTITLVAFKTDRLKPSGSGDEKVYASNDIGLLISCYLTFRLYKFNNTTRGRSGRPRVSSFRNN